MTYGYCGSGNFIPTGTLTRPPENQILSQSVYYNLELRIEATSGTVSVKLSNVDIGSFPSHYPVIGSGGYALQNGYGSQTEAHFRKFVLA